MRRRHRIFAAWLGAATVLCGPGAAAAQSDAERTEIQRLLAEVTRLRHQEVLDAVSRGSVNLVSTAVGPVAMYTLEERRAAVVKNMQELWTDWERAVAGLNVGRTAIVVTVRGDPEPVWPIELDTSYDYVFTGRAGDDSRRGVELAVRQAFREMLKEWAPEHLRSIVDHSHASERRVANSLFTSELSAAAGCRQGDAKQCWRMLRLVDTVPDWHAWTTPAERRAGVENIPIERLDDGQRPIRMKCVTDRSDRDCDLILFQNWIRILPSPWNGLRQHFFAFALAEGGVGSFTRFAESGSASIRDALVFTSGMEGRALIEKWIGSLGADPEIRRQEDKKDRWAAVLWIAFFLIPIARCARWHSR